MAGVCPLCGATLNLGLKFCVVCGRAASGEESSKMGGIKTGIRAADSTARIDAEDAMEAIKRGTKTPLRFRHVRSFWMQLFYIFVFMSLFFCAIRFVLETVWPGKLQRTFDHVQREIKKMPVSKMIPPELKQAGQTKSAPKKKSRRRHH